MIIQRLKHTFVLMKEVEYYHQAMINHLKGYLTEPIQRGYKCVSKTIYIN